MNAQNAIAYTHIIHGSRIHTPRAIRDEDGNEVLI